MLFLLCIMKVKYKYEIYFTSPLLKFILGKAQILAQVDKIQQQSLFNCQPCDRHLMFFYRQ